jgi:hypothetical protein
MREQTNGAGRATGPLSSERQGSRGGGYSAFKNHRDPNQGGNDERRKVGGIYKRGNIWWVMFTYDRDVVVDGTVRTVHAYRASASLRKAPRAWLASRSSSKSSSTQGAPSWRTVVCH